MWWCKICKNNKTNGGTNKCCSSCYNANYTHYNNLIHIATNFENVLEESNELINFLIEKHNKMAEEVKCNEQKSLALEHELEFNLEYKDRYSKLQNENNDLKQTVKTIAKLI